ncbi:PAS domain-containing sensor histidine kinase [Methanofollis fontis]|uniref:histidine kinase n=1 Tax=Methanofollis fontis TaxID=2052832 RepID=A0A483CR97_9EURY|nr:PAS domain-containing sensor histidine kinase [Methanofollis fontis]TAJ45338.1 hypothetical protein CUJ86_00915 [Methanofollis fontis]
MVPAQKRSVLLVGTAGKRFQTDDLEKQGDRWTVRAVPSSSDALTHLQEEPADLVVLCAGDPGIRDLLSVFSLPTPPSLVILREGAPPLIINAVKRASGDEIPEILSEAMDDRDHQRLLGEQERQLSTLLGSLPGMAYRCKNTPTHTMEFVSQGCLPLLGYPAEDLIGDRRVAYGDLIHPDDREGFWEAIQDAIDERRQFTLRYRVRTADGRTRWVREQGRGVVGEDGTLEVLEGFITDITPEAELRDEIERRGIIQTAILDNIPDLAWLKDGEGHYIAVNQAFEHASGFSRSEVVGRTDLEIWPRYLAERYMNEDREAMRSGCRQALVEPFVRVDGLETWVETVKTPIRNRSGNVTGTAGIARDITERRAMEEALRKSEERYRLFLLNFQGIAFRTGPDLLPLFLYGDVLGITGYTPDQLLRQKEIWEEVIYPADREGFLGTLEKTTRTGTAGAVDLRIIGKDGRVRWLHASVQRVADDSGHGVQGALFDITDRKDAEEQIRYLARFPQEDPGPVMRIGRDGIVAYANEASKPLLEEWGTSVGELLPPVWRSVVRGAVADGRSRTRDVSVRGAEYQLVCVPIPEGGYVNLYGVEITDRRAMEVAVWEANRKLNLLNSIIRHDILNQITVLQGYIALTLQKGEGGEYLKRITDATERIRRQVEFTRDYHELGVKGPVWQSPGREMDRAWRSLSPVGITLHSTVDPDLQVFADPLFWRVLYNLVDNTVRHAAGATEIRFSAASAGEEMHLIYEDNGPGIPAGQKESLFKEVTGQKKGLGMFLSREILSLTGLLIHEEGEPGQGARFVITVPEGGFRRRPDDA